MKAEQQAKNYGLRSPIVYDVTIVYCRWCMGRIRSYASKIRRKEFTEDKGKTHSITDYHEGCWCEAIEVQI